MNDIQRRVFELEHCKCCGAYRKHTYLCSNENVRILTGHFFTRLEVAIPLCKKDNKL